VSLLSPLAFLGVLLIADAHAQMTVGEDPRLEVARTRVEEQDVLGELDRIDRQLHGLTQEVDALQEQLDGVEARRLQAEDALAAAEAQLARESKEVACRCNALYRLTRRGLARVLFGSDSPQDLRRRTRYLLAILEHDRARLKAFLTVKSRKQDALKHVDRDRATIAALQAELRLKEAELRDERAQRLALLEDVRERKSLALQLLAQRSQASERFTASFQRSRRQVSSATNASFRSAHGKLPWPTSGQIVRGFGPYQDPFTGQSARSHGISIEAAYGTPFRAVFDGTVEQAGFIPGHGQTVVLDHGAYSTVYAHANGLRVTLGQVVSQGDVLGFVGNSGLMDSAGYRLHFEIRYNGTPQDPLSWLRRR